METQDNVIKNQIIPILLTFVVFAALIGVLFLQIFALNKWYDAGIGLNFHLVGILVGMTIYLKTSVDFAIFIARLMDANRGWKSRVAIEIGTALGNGAGTFVVLFLWVLFKDIHWLLALMIFVAALVLFRLAEDGLSHAKESEHNYGSWFGSIVRNLETGLSVINKITLPLLKFLLPNLKMQSKAGLSFWGLFSFSFTIPFILGLDDFAGYVPLFDVINVFSFATGVLLGHMVLNALLYASPDTTIRVVKNGVISLLGTVAFIALALWGIWEAVRVLIHG